MLRTTQINHPDGGQTTFSYHPYDGGYYVAINAKIDTLGNYTYSPVWVDGLGRKGRVAIANGETLRYDEPAVICYDGLGRVNFSAYPFQDNGWTGSRSCTIAGDSFTYDALSRPTRVTHSDGSYVSASYSGNTTTVTDEQGKTRESFTDGLGRLTQVIENPGGLNYSTIYTYDTLDNMTGVTQAGSRQRTFVYDSLSRLTSSTNPESGATAYTYDGDGNVATKTDARNITTTYSYDALNRVTQKTYSGGSTPSAFFAYDTTNGWGVPVTNMVGRLTEKWTGQQCCANFDAEIFSYDPMGRIILTETATGKTMNYTYDLLGDITSYTNPSGIVFSQSFNVAGRVNQITSNLIDAQHPGTLVSSIHYNAAGGMTAATTGNGLTDTATYNPRVQPCRMNVNSSGTVLGSCTDAIPSSNVLDLNYGFNYGAGDNGNVMSWTATGAQVFNRSYGYDALNRLSTMSSPGSACSGLSWTDDAWGNRTDQTVTGGTCGTFHQSVDGNNRVSGTPYQYDAAGNMTHDASHSYTYDAENRLTQVDGGSTASYIYDADGLRVQKTASGVTTSYIYDLAGRVTCESNTSQACWNVDYIYLNGGLAAIYQNGTTYFAHADHLGSTRLLTAYPTPSIVECDDYYPYGELIPCGSTGYTTHKFTGQERDNESNLDNFRARYNSSSMGRFMSADPSGLSLADPTDPQQLNLYAYVRNSPLSLVDPTGLDGEEPPTWCDPDFGCGSCGIYMCGGGPPPDMPNPVVTFMSISSAPPTIGLPSGFLATGPGIDFSWPSLLSRAFGLPDNTSDMIIFNWHTNTITGARVPDDGDSVCSGDGGCQYWNADLWTWAPTPPLSPDERRIRAFAKELNKTGVQSLGNPCTIAAWYTGSAVVGAGGVAAANASAIGTAAVEEYPTLVHRFLTWLNGLQPRPGTLFGTIQLVKAAPDKIRTTCSELQ